MPVGIHKDDRKILIGAGLVLVAVVAMGVLLRPAAESEERPEFFPSSYSAGRSGARAAFLLLDELGYEVERWDLSCAKLPAPGSGTVLVLAEPRLRRSQSETDALCTFINSGGRVLATGQTGAEMLPHASVLPTEWPFSPGQDYTAATPSPLTRATPVIRMAPRAQWLFRSPNHVPIYGDEDHPAVVSYTVGRGRVIWWASPGPLTNTGLKEDRNVALLLNAIGSASEVRVLWDEYHHGAAGSLWEYLSGTPVKWLLVQAALVFLAALLTFARRWGPVRAPVVEPRLSPIEFVETLGDLYHRGGAASAAVETTYQRFRYLLVRRLGLPSNSGIAELSNGVHNRLRWKEPGFLEELRRCESAIRNPDLTSEQALYRVQALHDYIRLLRLSPSP